MKLVTTNKGEIREVLYGVYMWQMPNGQFVGDDEGHFLMIASTEGDPTRIQAMRNAVSEFGIDEGKPVFFSGHRIVTDEEYEEQKQRMEWGLTPDPMDVPAILEDRRRERNSGRR